MTPHRPCMVPHVHRGHLLGQLNAILTPQHRLQLVPEGSTQAKGRATKALMCSGSQGSAMAAHLAGAPPSGAQFPGINTGARPGPGLEGSWGDSAPRHGGLNPGRQGRRGAGRLGHPPWPWPLAAHPTYGAPACRGHTSARWAGVNSMYAWGRERERGCARAADASQEPQWGRGARGPGDPASLVRACWS
jgi:hypothetical protein